METISINIETETVVINGQLNTFEEAGLKPNGEVVTDHDTIEEHLNDRLGGEFYYEYE